MKTRTIVLDWVDESDDETIDAKTLSLVSWLYADWLPYGLNRVYVKELAQPEKDAQA